MPERPDLEYVVPLVAARVEGRAITGVRVRKPIVLRAPVPPETLVGAKVERVTRRGHFVCFALDGAWDVSINLMLAGRFVFAEVGAKDPGDLAVALAFGDEELRYRDDVQMGKMYLHPRSEPPPGREPVGVDVLAPEFTAEKLAAMAKKRREQVKVWLMDKATFDSFGNAYADETLFEAGLHPKATVATLSGEQIGRLHAAMRTVLGGAIAEIQRRKPPLDEKVRDFLKVRNRGGEACPKCGTKIRTAGVHGHDAFFCPTCQPDTAGKGFVGWSRGA